MEVADDFDEVDFSVSHALDPTDEPLIKLMPVDNRDSSLPHATTAESRKPNGMTRQCSRYDIARLQSNLEGFSRPTSSPQLR